MLVQFAITDLLGCISVRKGDVAKGLREESFLLFVGNYTSYTNCFNGGNGEQIGGSLNCSKNNCFH